MTGTVLAPSCPPPAHQPRYGFHELVLVIATEQQASTVFENNVFAFHRRHAAKIDEERRATAREPVAQRRLCFFERAPRLNAALVRMVA